MAQTQAAEINKMAQQIKDPYGITPIAKPSNLPQLQTPLIVNKKASLITIQTDLNKQAISNSLARRDLSNSRVQLKPIETPKQPDNLEIDSSDEEADYMAAAIAKLNKKLEMQAEQRRISEAQAAV